MRAGAAIASVGPEVCRDLEAALGREWLVTNGLGGYASGSLAGPPTRRYHGWLIAAIEPPVHRTVLVGALVEWATAARRRVALHDLETADGTLRGGGHRRLRSVELDGQIPVFTFDLNDTMLERRIWMEHGANTTYVRYAVVRGDVEVELEVAPLVTTRDHHAATVPRPPSVTAAGERRVTARIGDGPRVTVAASSGRVRTAARRGLVGLRHREERARGEADRTWVRPILTFRATVGPGRPWTLVMSAEEDPDTDGEAALARARARAADLLSTAGASDASPFVQRLVLAADQFLVRRPVPRADGSLEDGATIIAGYPWFNDWGRDTMIALPGLALSTGRHREAAAALRAFARFVRDGLVPNDFPDRAGASPAYHTADASLWYPIALRAYEIATRDRALVDELLPTLRSIVDHHVAGTRFGIARDPVDGLLRAAADGYGLTWMDAKVDDWVVTPRRGKPVEIQALWVNALRIIGGWLLERGDPDGAGTHYTALADQAAESFRVRFWRPELGHLADVVDGPGGDDLSLRPNQLLALSLPHPLVGGAMARAVVEVCRRELLTPFGLRSLAPSDPAYRRAFQGDRRFRDAAYHQGATWAWLSGPYAVALARVTGDAAQGRAALLSFEPHLRDAGLGSISEIFEPEPPHAPRGCIAQAWSVAEVLRAWRALGGA